MDRREGDNYSVSERRNSKQEERRTKSQAVKPICLPQTGRGEGKTGGEREEKEEERARDGWL